MERRLTIAFILISLAASSASCGTPQARTDKRLESGEPVPAAADAATGTDDAACSKLLDAMRSLRDGKHPCSAQADCSVWHNGEYWDGCPPEVNVSNEKKLDAMRKEIEAAGCPVEKNANCAPQIVRGCVSGECGGFPAFILKLTDDQKAAIEAKKMPKVGEVGMPKAPEDGK